MTHSRTLREQAYFYPGFGPSLAPITSTPHLSLDRLIINNSLVVVYSLSHILYISHTFTFYTFRKMAAASYYAEPGVTQEKPQLLPDHTRLEGHDGQPQGLGQKMQSETHSYSQQGYNQGYNEQSSGTYSGQQQQQLGNTTYGQGAPQQQMNEQNNGVYGGQHQQQMGNSNYAQGAGQQQMNGGVGQAAGPDNRDTITKCNDNPPDYVGGIERMLVSVNGESHQSCTEKNLSCY